MNDEESRVTKALEEACQILMEVQFCMCRMESRAPYDAYTAVRDATFEAAERSLLEIKGTPGAAAMTDEIKDLENALAARKEAKGNADEHAAKLIRMSRH